LVWIKTCIMNKIFFLLILLFTFSCSETVVEENNIIENEAQKETKEEKADIPTKEEALEVLEKVDKEKEDLTKPILKNILPKECNFGDIKIIISEHNDEINIKSNNKFVEDINKTLDGTINAFIETDVDEDGFNEFYCVSNIGDIIAYSSYKNKSFGEIMINRKPSYFYKDCNEVKFWEVKNKQLSITFSNVKDELSTVRYKLVQGETAYSLVAD